MALPRRPTPRPTTVFPGTLPPPVVEALQRGEKIQAIRLMREIAGVGLKQAKEAVDGSPHAVAATRRGLSPGEVPRVGRVLWTVIALALVGLVVYLLNRGGS